MLSYSGRHMDRAGVSTIAVNGVVYGKRDDMGPGQRVWVEEEPWFLPGHGWYSCSFPVRFEDGMLDWDRLSQDARKEVARADAFMRRTYGITSPPPPVEAPAPGVPCELGWLMPIVRCPARLEVRGRAHAVRLSNEFNVIEGEGGNFALSAKLGMVIFGLLCGQTAYLGPFRQKLAIRVCRRCGSMWTCGYSKAMTWISCRMLCVRIRLFAGVCGRSISIGSGAETRPGMAHSPERALPAVSRLPSCGVESPGGKTTCGGKACTRQQKTAK